MALDATPTSSFRLHSRALRLATFVTVVILQRLPLHDPVHWHTSPPEWRDRAIFEWRSRLMLQRRCHEDMFEIQCETSQIGFFQGDNLVS